MQERRSISPFYPAYASIQRFIKVMNNVDITLLKRMETQIQGYIGTPQQTVDWSNPDIWIQERLKGQEQSLAMNLWSSQLNPRYSNEPMYLTRKYGLLDESGNLFKISVKGQEFLSGSENTAIAEIDAYEGVFDILHFIAERPGKMTEFLDTWATFCRTWTNYDSERPIYESLRRRINNLIARNLVERTNQQYQVTDMGIQYLKKNFSLVSSIDEQTAKPQNDLISSTRQISKDARQQLRDYLSKMNPYLFEHLIKRLLEDMGYENVQVTAQSNDKGVDVVADIQLGISSVREVVQVKRHSSNVRRDVLDGLRGSLHRFDAVKGTIITLSNFADGAKKAAFERGAAPITLIDGEKLIDLLTEYQIGITTKSVTYNSPYALSDFYSFSQRGGGLQTFFSPSLNGAEGLEGKV